MSLRKAINRTAWSIRLGGFAGLVWCGGLLNALGLGFVFGTVWLLVSGGILRELILPILFPKTVCPGCRRTLPLVGRWKCGDHYIDHRDRHILAFYCCHGHVLEGFDCPRCKATILVQYGDPQRVRHGTALRLRALSTQLSRHGFLLGHNDLRREVRLPPDRLAWHMAVTGGTGRGKSTMLGNLIEQFAADGKGFSVLDPGGDLARAALDCIPSHREEDVLYVDVADREHPPPINVLHARDAAEGAVLTEELLAVFHRLHGASWGPQLAHQLRMALRAVMTVGGSLQDVYGMFTDAATRSRVIAGLHESAVRAFWINEFPSIPAIRRSAVTNKLAPVVLHPVLAPMLCTRHCVLDADELIGHRQILIANLASGSPGDDVTALLGTFLVQKILAAAFRQALVPREERTPHVLVVDEFQRFMHRAASFDQILAESRKYKLSLVVANQYVEQLEPAVRAALFGNVGCLASFRVGHRDAAVIAPEFTGASTDELMELELGKCLVRIGTDWSNLHALPPAQGRRNGPAARIIALNRERRDQLHEPVPPIAIPDPDDQELVQ